MRAYQKFTLAEQRPDPLDHGADQLRNDQVKDITMKSVQKKAQVNDMCILYNIMLKRGKEPIAASQKTTEETSASGCGAV